MRPADIRISSAWHEAMLAQHMSMESVGEFYHAVFLYATGKEMTPALPAELQLLFAVAKADIDAKENTPTPLKEKSVLRSDSESDQNGERKTEEQLLQDERMHEELSSSLRHLQSVAKACDCALEDVSYVLQAFLSHTKAQSSAHSHTDFDDYYKHLMYWINKRKSYIPTIISYGKSNNAANTASCRAAPAESPAERVLPKKDYSRGFFGS